MSTKPGPYRLAAPAGACIDRTQTLGFTFNDVPLTGFRGDTLASALLGNGVRLVGRSFKLHRPRGVWSCGAEEPSALVDVGEGARRTPNVRVTQLPLVQGLRARSVNCWPSVGFDLGALTGMLGGLLPAGFYYKTFMWPNWRVFEPAIRRMAGLGRAPAERDADTYEEISATADVLVVGGGLAGLAAAAAAAGAGARTLLLMSGARPGGALGWQQDPEVAALEAQLVKLGVQVLPRTVAFGIYDHNLVCACESVACEGAAGLAPSVLRERLWKIRARTVIAATGAFERPLIFPDNDRPGVMLASAALRYAGAYAVGCGRRAVIAAASDRAYALARSLSAFGVEIAAIVDGRPAAAAGVSCTRQLPEARITAVHGARGVRGCTVAQSARSGAALRL